MSILESVKEYLRTEGIAFQTNFKLNQTMTHIYSQFNVEFIAIQIKNDQLLLWVDDGEILVARITDPITDKPFLEITVHDLFSSPLSNPNCLENLVNTLRKL